MDQEPTPLDLCDFLCGYMWLLLAEEGTVLTGFELFCSPSQPVGSVLRTRGFACKAVPDTPRCSLMKSPLYRVIFPSIKLTLLLASQICNRKILTKTPLPKVKHKHPTGRGLVLKQTWHFPEVNWYDNNLLSPTPIFFSDNWK